MSDMDEIRRKSDVVMGELIGEFRQFMKDYDKNNEEAVKWRNSIENRFKPIESFLDELKTPHKIVVWTVRAVALASIGGIVTYVIGFFKNHFSWR